MNKANEILDIRVSTDEYDDDDEESGIYLNHRRIESPPADSHLSWSMTDKEMNLAQEGLFSGLNQRINKSTSADLDSSWSLSDKNLNSSPTGRKIFSRLNSSSWSISDKEINPSPDGFIQISGDLNYDMNDYNLPLIHSIKDIYIQSNSPLSMSENNSANQSDNDSDEDERGDKNIISSNKTDPLSMDKYYEYDDKHSSNLDILITYTRCQKSIYLKARNITEANLYLFMIPTILIGIIISILAPEISIYNWGAGLISGLNILMTALISLSNYLKLESKTEMFSQLTKQYDKIEISLEMANNKLLFLDSEKEKNHLILHKLNDIEIKLNELAEINCVSVPEIIKHSFPIICHINIFSLIKKLEIYKKTLIQKFVNVKNEIRYILNKWKRRDSISNNELDKNKERTRLLFLYSIKDKIKIELAEYNHVYSFIDEYFSKEIAQAESMNNFWILFCSWFSRKPTFNKLDISKQNHIIDKYFRFIFDD